MKAFFTKLGNGIKTIFSKLGQLILQNAREILKFFVALGIDTLIMGTTYILVKNNAVQAGLGINLGGFGTIIAWAGAVAISFVVSHAVSKYVDEEMNDIFQTLEETKQQVNDIVAAAYAKEA